MLLLSWLPLGALVISSGVVHEVLLFQPSIEADACGDAEFFTLAYEDRRRVL